MIKNLLRHFLAKLLFRDIIISRRCDKNTAQKDLYDNRGSL